MTIASGTNLGSYEILLQIGAGGMGEVYKAHDTKLGREVAIKVLPEAFAHDAERLSRFQREAKMLASLNHPNIATIHGLEHSNGTHFLIMELVSGETLAERIKRDRAVPIEEALAIAKQIAEALETAHEKGIIHRDLKPANVKVTPEGKVKVLDFGLAKAFAGDGASEDPSNSPTLSMTATMHGVILGTAAYMSPEQARGKSVDKRTDIWAFGCVLYELLTGKHAFEGETVTEILAAVLKGEPDWQVLPSTTPVQIRSLLRRCLQKDKTLRMQAAGDARIEIQEALIAPTPAEPISVAPSRPGRTWRQMAVFGLALLVGMAVSGLAVWNLKPAPAKPVSRMVINLPPGDQLAAQDFPAIAISPDGTQLAYVAIHAGTRQIFLRALDSLEAKPLSGTEGANTPFFSPDGQSLGFFAGGRLKKISVSGGAALTLGNAAVPSGATWGSNGTIIFAPTAASVLEQISDAGGAPQALTHLDNGDVAHGWPELLPSSNAVLFAGGGGGPNPEIAVQSRSSGERRNLVAGGTAPHYAATGHLIFAQGGNLMAVPFDGRRLQVTGAAIPVVEGVLQSGFVGGVQYALSNTGSLVYVLGGSLAAERLVWVSRNGTEQALAAPPRTYIYPRISPEGRRVAVGIVEEGIQLWLYDLARDALTRLTFGGNTNFNAAWTPDGKRIAFLSNKEGPQNVFWQLADGSGGLERLTTSEYTQPPRSFSSDGKLLAFVEIDPTTGYDIWILRLSDRKAQPFLRTPFNESVPAFSPDGRSLAYISDESGRFEIYVQPYPGPGSKYQISTEGGTEPVWNPNGKELFYRSGDKMMAVDITTQPSFSVGKPRMLFQGPYVPTPITFPFYDVSPDGQRFLMIKPSEQTSSSSLTQIVVVQNWFEELKRRVPAEK
jgi:serine/threonine protein kinase/Tol biopolymer transport system component